VVGKENNIIKSPSEYEWCLQDIKNFNSSIEIITEVGSRDGIDAIKIAKVFNSKENYVFEADPELIEEIKINIDSFGDNRNFKIFNLALGDEDKEVIFYAVDKKKYPNKGVGSLFKIDFENREKSDPDYLRSDVQKEIKINQNKYTSLNLPMPDLLLIDVEGAEYEVLRGFENNLRRIKFIVLESSISENQIGAKTFINIHKLLKNDFKLIKNTRYGKNSKLFLDFYKNKMIFKKSYIPSFDLFYVNKKILWDQKK